MNVLVLNAGSSSHKSCFYEFLETTIFEEPLQPLWEAKVDWSHHQGFAEIEVKTAKGAVFKEEFETDSRSVTIAKMLETLWSGETQVIGQPADINIVGHRVVHGGSEYRESVFINAEIKAAIARLAVFAPVHNPVNLEGIEAVEQVLGIRVCQVAVFDTAFHAHLSEAVYTYAGSYEWLEKGIRRYGFHGISHQYCVQRAAHILGRNLQDLRLICCHLGNGCSLAAIRDGFSVDTTMGFTPLEGLMMGTRSGSVDPGILIYLMRQEGYRVEQLDEVLNKAAGLKGISGISADFRSIMEEISQNNQRAKLAFEMYVHSLRRHIGAMLASLGGLDALIFTAGVGENAPTVRAEACKAFEFLGLKLDVEANNKLFVEQDISTPESTVRVLVIHTQEDWEIAKQCCKLAAK